MHFFKEHLILNAVKYFFLFSRIAVVISRPLLLFYVVMLDDAEDEALELTLLITVAVSLLMLANVDAHREFYKAYFNVERRLLRVAKEYIRLVNFFAGLFIGLYIFYFLSSYLVFESLFIALLFSYNVIIEKIFDEFQRFTMFEKKYLKWSILALAFWLLPVLGTIIIYEVSGLDIVKIFILSSLIVYSGVLLFMLKEIRFIRLSSRFNLMSLLHNIKTSFLVYISRFSYLLANFAVGHVLVITRYGVLLIEPLFLPVYVLFQQCGGVILSVVDMLYMAFRREKFVKSSVAAFDSLKDKKLISILICGVIVASLACLIMAYSKFSSFTAYLGVITVVISMCSAYSISSILFESVFWHRSISQRLVIEIIYFFLTGIVLLLAIFENLSLIMALVGFLACFLVRILSQIRLLKF